MEQCIHYDFHWSKYVARSCCVKLCCRYLRTDTILCSTKMTKWTLNIKKTFGSYPKFKDLCQQFRFAHSFHANHSDRWRYFKRSPTSLSIANRSPISPQHWFTYPWTITVYPRSVPNKSTSISLWLVASVWADFIHHSQISPQLVSDWSLLICN